jgi:hypothetical protein
MAKPEPKPAPPTPSELRALAETLEQLRKLAREAKDSRVRLEAACQMLLVADRILGRQAFREG